MIDKNLLGQGIEELGLKATEEQLNLMDLYAQNLVETNKYLNLTRVTDPEKIVTDHFLDSVAVLTVFSPKKGHKILDIGTGAGFPGVPLAIMNPDCKVTMMDSTGKKINFVKETCKKLNITNVTFITGRAEEEAHKNHIRESFDLAVARAVSNMKILSEIAIPFVLLGGTFVALKSSDCQDETQKAVNTIKNMGGKIIKIHKKIIPVSNIERSLVYIEKISKTQKKYPRPYGEIVK